MIFCPSNTTKICAEKKCIPDNTNRGGLKWTHGRCCAVTNDAEKAQYKLMPLNLSCGASRLVAVTVPAAVDEHGGITGQCLTQGFKTPAY